MRVCHNSIRSQDSNNIIRVTGVTLNFACALAALRCVFEDTEFTAKRNLHRTKTDDRKAIVSQEYRFMVYEGHRQNKVTNGVDSVIISGGCGFGESGLQSGDTALHNSDALVNTAASVNTLSSISLESQKDQSTGYFGTEGFWLSQSTGH